MSGPWEEYQKQEKKQSADSSGPWDDYKQKRGFTAPLKEMSVEGWKKESIAYPTLQTMYGLMPFQGKQGEQAFTQGMQGIQEKGDAIVQGVKTIAQDPAAAAQAAWKAVTERPGETLGNLVKGAVYDPELLFVPGAKQVSQAVGAVARPVVQGVKNVGGAVADVTGGAYGALRGNIARPGEIPASYQKPSVRQPVGETYYTPEQIQAWRAGELPTEQLTPKPITDLGPQAMSALQRTEGNVPYAGQGWRALGEQIGETYRNPVNLLTDVGLDVLTSGGLPTAARMGYKGYQGVQGARAANTLQKAGFTAMYPEEFAALQAGKPHPSAIGPVAGPAVPRAQPTMVSPVTTQAVEPQSLPQLTYNPTQPVMYASETGIVGKSPQAVVEADLAQRYAPQPVAAVAQETPVTQPVKPLAVVDDVAKTPEQLAAEQKILDFINARRGATPEPEPQPVAEPKKRISQEQRIREREAQMTPEELAAQQAEVERNLAKSRGKPVTTTSATQQYASPSEMRKALIGTMSSDQLDNLVKQTFPSADTLKQKMAQPKTPEDAALSEALRQRLESLKTQGKYKPPGVMEMVSDDMAPRKIGKFDEVYPTKEAMDYETMFSTLGDKNPRVKRYQEGNTIVEITQINYGTAPKELLRQLNKPTTATRTYDAKTGKQLSGPPKD